MMGSISSCSNSRHYWESRSNNGPAGQLGDLVGSESAQRGHGLWRNLPGREFAQEFPGCLGDKSDGALESFFGMHGSLGDTADLAAVLACGSDYFVVGGDWLKSSKRGDVSAHGQKLAADRSPLPGDQACLT